MWPLLCMHLWMEDGSPTIPKYGMFIVSLLKQTKHPSAWMTDKPSKALDIQLRNTVLDILTNFLRENDAIIVYYCDPFDGKGYKRYLKFNRWFDLINDPSIEKQDGEFTVTDLRIDEYDHLMRSELTVYASILLRKTHPDYDAVIRLFHSGDMDKTGKL